MEKQALFGAAGFIQEASGGELPIGYMDVPRTKLFIELVCCHHPKRRMKPVFFKVNNISSAHYVAWKVINGD